MDIPRPEFKQKKRARQIIWTIGGLAIAAAATVMLMRLEPAAPSVPRA